MAFDLLSLVRADLKLLYTRILETVIFNLCMYLGLSSVEVLIESKSSAADVNYDLLFSATFKFSSFNM